LGAKLRPLHHSDEIQGLLLVSAPELGRAPIMFAHEDVEWFGNLDERLRGELRAVLRRLLVAKRTAPPGEIDLPGAGFLAEPPEVRLPKRHVLFVELACLWNPLLRRGLFRPGVHRRRR